MICSPEVDVKVCLRNTGASRIFLGGAPEILFTNLRLNLLNNKQLRGLVHQQTIPTERPPLVGEVSVNFSGWGCRVVSATNPHSR
jgi:hypothetical protein